MAERNLAGNDFQSGALAFSAIWRNPNRYARRLQAKFIFRAPKRKRFCV